jgi:primosomal protein N'
MKLNELAVTRPTQQIAKVFESHFDQQVQFDSMNRDQLHNMYRKVRGVLSEHRSGPARHSSERDPAYLKLMMMEQALAEQIYEDEMAAANTAAPAPGVNPQQAAAMAAKQKMDQKTQIQKELEDLKKQVTDKQNELTNLSSTTSVQEHRRRAQTYGYYLSESEVQQAQVVLAAQDMVDKMQGMIEDTTEMQFKELPALVDSIKNQIGADQAAQFNNDAQAALTGLVQNLQGSKQQLEQALGVVTGQGPVEMPGAEMAPPPAGVAQIDVSMTEPSPEEELDAAAVGPAASLGRERR